MDAERKKKYVVYDLEHNLVKIGTREECAEYMRMSLTTFAEHVRKLRNGGIKNGKRYNAYALEYDTNRYFRVTKDVLAYKKINDNWRRLVKIPKGKIYVYDPFHNRRGKIIKLATKVVQVSEETRRYYNEIQMTHEEFEKYFEEIKKKQFR